MEKIKLTDAEVEQTTGGELIFIVKEFNDTSIVCCNKCGSKNVHLRVPMRDVNGNLASDGTLTVDFRSIMDYRYSGNPQYETVCEDCGAVIPGSHTIFWGLDDQ